MKNRLLFFFLLLALTASSQKIDGFYTGVLHNDSARMIQKYELAIAMYKGKISGYSYVTFIANDTFYYGIRKVKGEIIGDSMIIEDDKHVSNNFPEPPAKGIRRTITIPLHGQDSLTMISGNWKTNQRKNYYSVPGTIELAKSSDSSKSPLINHLKELNIIPSENQYAVAYANPKPEKQKTEVKEVKVKEDKIKIEVKEKEKEKEVMVKNTAPVKLPFDQRKSKEMQILEVAADSLVLAFYDNGVVDGDSISVYMNGVNIISNVKLTTSANKKSVSVANLDEVELTLVAENLGTIPPNTGLLTIRDGETVYQVNFSADMQTNAMIRIRKKK